MEIRLRFLPRCICSLAALFSSLQIRRSDPCSIPTVVDAPSAFVAKIKAGMHPGISMPTTRPDGALAQQQRCSIGPPKSAGRSETAYSTR
jgi:hypothetical protein